MEESVFGVFILILTGIVTYNGFRDERVFNSYKFHVDKILLIRDYKRIITSGFLHGNWVHFGFNMIALTSFSASLERVLGIPSLAILYFACIAGGSLLSLYIHRNHGDYSAIGASGGVSGIVAAAIILNPMGGIGFILIPVSFPSWIFGLLYVIITIYAIKAQAGNIGHDAHLGGYLVGIIGVILIKPEIIFTSWWIILLLLTPILLFLIILLRDPSFLLVDNNLLRFRRKKETNWQKTAQQEREQLLNDILDKVKQSGINSLNYRERRILDKYREEL